VLKLVISETDMEKDINRFKDGYWKEKYYRWRKADEFFNQFHLNYNLFDQSAEDIINVYKDLLWRIKSVCPANYYNIHKGIPFFSIGLSSFFLKHYDHAIFYLDAAIAEDKKNHDNKELILGSWAPKFFLLESKEYLHFYNQGVSLAPDLENLLRHELERFNLKSNSNLTVNDFKDKFITKIIFNENTAIITTLYTFIFQKEEVLEMIRLRGKHGGSIEPMITHLFKGTLIFETLMKKHYLDKYMQKHPKEKSHKVNLGNLINFNYVQGKYNFSNSKHCRASSIGKILKFLDDEPYSLETTFYVTCKIRNTAGHYLLWTDLFTERNYKTFYDNILDAIFYLIREEYI